MTRHEDNTDAPVSTIGAIEALALNDLTTHEDAHQADLMIMDAVFEVLKQFESKDITEAVRVAKDFRTTVAGDLKALSNTTLEAQYEKARLWAHDAEEEAEPKRLVAVAKAADRIAALSILMSAAQIVGSDVSNEIANAEKAVNQAGNVLSEEEVASMQQVLDDVRPH